MLGNHPLVSGFSFGITSGVITSSGMVVGMFSATNSKLTVIAGLITIAITNGLTDGAGQHMSEEAEFSDGGTNPYETGSNGLLFVFILSLFYWD